MEVKIPDFTKLTWPLNVALIGAIFSIFALIYNTLFIYYGFITFAYGIICHLTDTTYNFWLKDKGWEPKFVFVSQSIITLIWIIVLLTIYK